MVKYKKIGCIVILIAALFLFFSFFWKTKQMSEFENCPVGYRGNKPKPHATLDIQYYTCYPFWAFFK